MTKPIPQEPRFVTNITALQKILAGMAVSMFLTVWITGWSYIEDFFKPNFITPLTYLRVGIALAAIAITSVIGYQQMKWMATWLLDSWQVYRSMLEFRNKKEEDKQISNHLTHKQNGKENDETITDG